MLLGRPRQWLAILLAIHSSKLKTNPLENSARHRLKLGVKQTRASMRGMLAPLSTHEEAALRKIGFGNSDPLAPAHLRRLLHLELVEWAGHTWRLTHVGRRRYESLVVEVVRPSVA
jgi:hypothetical protein